MHRPWIRRLTLLAVAAAAIAPTGQAGATSYPGEVTVAAGYDTAPAQVGLRSENDASGFAYSVGSPAHEVVVHDGVSHAYPVGDAVALAGATVYVGVPASGSLAWTATDLDTGATATVGTFPVQAPTTAPRLVAEAPSAWLTSAGSAQGALQLSLEVPGRAPQVVHTFPADATTIESGAADDTGALIEWEEVPADLSSITFRVGYVSYDLSDGLATWTDLPSSGGAFALAPHVLAYDDSAGDLVRASRADLSTISTRPRFNGNELVITDTASAVDSGPMGPDTPDRVTSCAEPAGPCGGLVLGKPTSTGQGDAIGVAAMGDSFVAAFGDTAATRAIRTFTPGATAPGPVLAQPSSGPPLSVSLAAGKLAIEQPTLTYEQRADSSRGRGVLGSTVVDDSAQTGTPEFQAASSGQRTAFVRCVSAHSCEKTETVVSDAGTVTAILPGGDATPSLAGSRVLVPGVTKSELYDVEGGALGKPVTEPAMAAMDGDRLVWATADHRVMLRDLAHPGAAPVTLRPAPATPSCEQEVQPPEVSADWVLWDFDCENDLFTHDAHATAVHLSAGNRIDRSVTIPVTQRAAEAHLSDGAVSLIATDPGDPTGASQGPAPVHVINLDTGADTVVGEARAAVSNRSYLAASDELVAWVGDDDLVHVIPNPVHADSGPILLGSTTMVAAQRAKAATAHLFLAGGTKKQPAAAYRVEIDASRPLSSYVATLRDARGHVVLKLHGAAATGGVVLGWNGRSAGRAAAAGRYTWTISASGAGGVLTSHGRRVTPKVTLTVRSAGR